MGLWCVIEKAVSARKTPPTPGANAAHLLETEEGENEGGEEFRGSSSWTLFKGHKGNQKLF